VHHGGAGTSHTAVAAGIPSVVVPHVGDQGFWASRLHALGAATRPIAPRRLSANTLADRVREAATSAALRAGAQRLAALVGADEGLAASVRLLEEAAASR
jgi:UDP:flavonoid glycosyltransferase YjiC (YdhE family)